MVTFKSLIIFDAETTSLPKMDHNTTKIIELAFLGCEVEHLKDCDALPRVLHKLILLFNPNKLIHPDASKVSGLNNELLMNVKPFREEDAEVLRQFISRLPPPVCIIAHNGDNFDFPILRRALNKVNKELQNNVYCADSIKAFRNLLSRSKQGQHSFCTEQIHPTIQYKSTKENTETIQMRMHNETTPQHQRTQPVNSLQHKHVSRELFPDDTDFSEWVLPKENEPKTVKPKSFKLKDIYYFYFQGYFMNSHRAEDDAKALLCCIMRCEGFFDWLNANAIVFNSIQPLF